MNDFSLKEFLSGINNPFTEGLRSSPGFAVQWAGLSYKDFMKELTVKLSSLDSKAKKKILNVTWEHSPSGVEADVEYSYFDDTKVLEISGRIVNRGRKAIKNVNGPFSLVVNTEYPGMGTPKMTTIYGGSYSTDAYPPKAYSISQIEGTTSLIGGRECGRSTETEMPYLILTDEKEQYGIFCTLEWPCRWIFNLSRETADMELIGHVAYTCFELLPEESVCLPRASVGFFEGDTLRGGNALRKHIADNVIKPADKTVLPPVFYNSFYAYGLSMDGDVFKKDAEFYAGLGVEYFVIDAGWFKDGFRNGIGNWEYENAAAFPDGMKAFADYVRSLGMKFGSWLEIEFAMKESDWVKRHPDWFHRADGRRNFCWGGGEFADCLLKLDDSGVRNEVLKFLCGWVDKYGIEWLRWDMNNSPAPFLDKNDKSGDFGKLELRYGEGFYELLDSFIEKCPQVHIEACAGGGNRMDLGTLRRANSAWMNDNAESVNTVRRLQANLNRFLPGTFANSVQMTQRENSISQYMFSLRSKMAGSLGFAVPSKNISSEIRDLFIKEIDNYKSVRRFLLKDYYPLFNPRNLSEYDGWQFHDPELQEGFFMVFRNNSPCSETKIDLCGLIEGDKYEFTDFDTKNITVHKGGGVREISIMNKNGTGWYRYRKI